MKPSRGYEALRGFRHSSPGSEYFVTICVRERQPVLTNSDVASAVRNEIKNIEDDGNWRVRGAVLIPDHVHLFVTLGDSLTLGRAIARLKAKTRSALASSSGGWQGNFYERRLRPGDSAEDVLRYLFLNPYRAGLLKVSESYEWFWMGVEEEEWFKPLTNDERPFPEWFR